MATGVIEQDGRAVATGVIEQDGRAVATGVIEQIELWPLM